MDAQFWDERYSRHQQMFSGRPNGVLVTEVADLPPGRALDVGCGEGGDALWLAARGWQVTAVDISQVALDRAAALDREGRITWARADLTVQAPPPGPFDLVTVHYLPLPHAADVRTLLNAVAPGGTLLFVSHDLADLPPSPDIDPTTFYQPGEVAALLDETWTVLADETRPRVDPAPTGTHHTHDTVLLARRR